MSATYMQRGETLDYVNDGAAAIEAGDIVSLTTRVAVAACHMAVGTLGSINVEGVYRMPKAASVAISLGAKVYYDTSSGKINTTDTGVPAGYATAAAAAADSEVLVKLLG